MAMGVSIGRFWWPSLADVPAGAAVACDRCRLVRPPCSRCCTACRHLCSAFRPCRLAAMGGERVKGE